MPLRRKPTGTVTQAELDHYIQPALRGSRHEPRMKAYLEANPRGRPESEFLSPRVFTTASGWVDWARTRQPFALVIDSFDAHEPWDVPKRLSDMYGSPDPSGVEPIQPFPTPAAKYAGLGLTQSLLHRMRELYSAEITMVDTWLGRFLDDLANKGLLDNTLVVLCSDHGVLLGEYGWVGKRYTEVHTELSHVPFAIRHPHGKAKGKASRYWASHHDIGPTVLSALGYEKTDSMNGTDLTRLLDGKQPAQKRTYRTAAYATYRGGPRRQVAADLRQPGAREAALLAGPRARQPQRRESLPRPGEPAVGLHQEGRGPEGPAALQVGGPRSQPSTSAALRSGGKTG